MKAAIAAERKQFLVLRDREREALKLKRKHLRYTFHVTRFEFMRSSRGLQYLTDALEMLTSEWPR